MALDDILNRIEGDAVAQVQALVDAAEAGAARLLDDARESAAADAARTMHAAEADAERDAEALLATARLGTRDRALTARRSLVERALGGIEAAIVALPDDEYTSFLAKAVADSARGGERMLVAAADAARLGGLEAAVRARMGDAALRYGEATDQIEHGVILAGEREMVDLSIDGIVGGQRESLVMQLAEDLFGGRQGA